MRPYSPGGVLNALATAPRGSKPATPSTHRLRRGLPGYLILFAPHAFASQRQLVSRKPPSPPVFLLISTNFTSTPGILLPSPPLQARSFVRNSWVEPRAFTSDLQVGYTRFTPSNSEQRLHPLYYRGCWHRVSRCFLKGYRQELGLFALTVFFSLNRALQPEGLHHSRGVAGSGFRPLSNIPHCCLP